MRSKSGAGWKAAQGDAGRYFGEYGGCQDYHLYELTQEQFDLVQTLITSRNKENRGSTNADQFPNIFAGLLKCADCGYAMTMTRAHRTQRDEPIDCYI